MRPCSRLWEEVPNRRESDLVHSGGKRDRSDLDLDYIWRLKEAWERRLVKSWWSRYSHRIARGGDTGRDDEYRVA